MKRNVKTLAFKLNVVNSFFRKFGKNVSATARNFRISRSMVRTYLAQRKALRICRHYTFGAPLPQNSVEIINHYLEDLNDEIDRADYKPSEIFNIGQLTCQAGQRLIDPNLLFLMRKTRAVSIWTPLARTHTTTSAARA